MGDAVQLRQTRVAEGRGLLYLPARLDEDLVPRAVVDRLEVFAAAEAERAAVELYVRACPVGRAYAEYGTGRSCDYVNPVLVLPP